MGNGRQGTSRAIISLAGVTKRFAGHAAIDDLSLDLLEGEFFCLLGPSGCGKSTLLRILAGFEQADGGRLALDGRDLAPVPPHRRPLNIMFQSYALFPHLRVGANIAYGLKREGVGRAGIAGRVAEMLRLVRLDGLERRYPAQLSGGQRQRVALARALVKRPRVLLLDEPLSALDRDLRTRTQLELKDLQARLGTTFVMVTHDREEALALADRIGVMDRGRLVQVGTPRDVYERPATRFVAEFIGDANLLEGTLIEGDAAPSRVRLPGGREIAVRPVPGLAPGTPVAVAVRPERLRIARRGETGIPARVVDTVYLGGDTMVRAETEWGQVLRSLRPSGRAADLPAPGERLEVAFDPADAAVLR